MKTKVKLVESGIDIWLAELKQRQDNTDPQFPSGSIPSYRVYPVSKIRRADPNVFFSALIANKLTEWRHVMDEEQKNRTAAILKKIAGIFPLYKSRRGRIHYNFWPTKPDIPFPNGKLLHRLDFFRLPDDIDDTSLVYGALQTAPTQVKALQQDIERHFSDHYSNQPKFYAAWLGEKIPFVVDVCALANLLNLFNKSGLAATEFSSASSSYLREVILSRSYITSPYQVSPYYPDTAVIAYHLTSWLCLAGGPFEAQKQQLAADIKALAEKEKHPFRAMLYASSLSRLNADVKFQISFEQIQPFLPVFPWFFGSMLSAVKWKALRKHGNLKIFHIAHVSEAWNFTLWAEYQLLKGGARPLSAI